MKILNYDITLVRGDSANLTISNAENPFTTGDTVQFTVKDRSSGSNIINLEVTTFTDGKAVFTFTHDTTKSLTCGNYVYAIRTIRDGKYHTLVREKAFFLVEEGNPELSSDE